VTDGNEQLKKHRNNGYHTVYIDMTEEENSNLQESSVFNKVTN
jgi:hypothetical protein